MSNNSTLRLEALQCLRPLLDALGAAGTEVLVDIGLDPEGVPVVRYETFRSGGGPGGSETSRVYTWVIQPQVRSGGAEVGYLLKGGEVAGVSLDQRRLLSLEEVAQKIATAVRYVRAVEVLEETASPSLMEEVRGLQRRLERLERLGVNPPSVPKGFVVAQVIGWDGDADDSDFVEMCPLEFVVVPERFGDEVYVKLIGNDAFAGRTEGVYSGSSGEKRWSLPWYGCWGRTPEEAIEALPKAIITKEEQL